MNIKEYIEIFYDEKAMPCKVLLEYEFYRQLVDKARMYADLIQNMQQRESIGSGQSVDEKPYSKEPSHNQVANDIRTHRTAKGYYVDSKRFLVMQGSVAKATFTASFECRKYLITLRKSLINDGILRKVSDDEYEFTSDYIFSSSSTAACIVDGNMRSGPESWGKPRIYQPNQSLDEIKDVEAPAATCVQECGIPPLIIFSKPGQ